MKMRPQFNLRFRDAGQFLDIRYLASEADIPVNEWILRRLEEEPLLKGARLTAEMEAVNAAIKAGGSAGVEKDTVSPAGKRGVRKGAAGDRGKLLRGESVSGATAAKAEAVAPEWRCVCGSTGKRMKGKELVCFSCGRGA